MENLKENAKIWQETGSVHAAQLIYKDKSIIREDVSRHVAVDKVIGAAFKLRIRFNTIIPYIQWKNACRYAYKSNKSGNSNYHI